MNFFSLAGNVGAGSRPSECPVEASGVINPPVIASDGVPCDVHPTAGIDPAVVNRDAEDTCNLHRYRYRQRWAVRSFKSLNR